MDLLERANSRFEKILAAGDAAQEMQSLKDQMVACRMFMKGKPFPTFLKPYLIDERDKKLFHEATQVIVSACEKVGDVFFADDRFADLLEVQPRVAEFARISQVYPRRQVVARLDAFYHPQTRDLKFLEFNTDSPCGMGWHDKMVDMFANLPAMTALSKEFRLRADTLVAPLARCLQKKYREWCLSKEISPKDHPHYVIATVRESTVLVDLQIIRDIFIAKGLDCTWLDPRDFETKDGVLYGNGKPVDFIYRDDNQEFLSDENYTKAMSANDAYRRHEVPLVNPFCARVGGLKSVLAIMSDRKYHHIFTEREVDAFSKFIPWTRLVRDCETEYRGTQIRLKHFIPENKDQLVLKPNSGYGGFGVVIGADVGGTEWTDTLAKALSPGNNYVVQEMVPLPKDMFPVLDADNNLTGFEPKNVNLNLWSFDGEFGGAFVRASSSTVINVHQGGGLVPCFYVADYPVEQSHGGPAFGPL